MRYSVLVMSCDKNIKLLDCFFKYLKAFYDTSDVDVFLSLENAEYNNDFIEITCINDPNAKSWSHRLKNALKQINTKSVLLLLDDFIIESPVDKAEIRKLHDIIQSDDSVAHFALTTVPMKNASDEIFYEKFYKRHRFGRYKTTLQAGIWNKDELLTILNEKDNAWKVELYANMRSFYSKRDYYAITDKALKPIDYNDGFFCVQGKLNEEEVIRLTQKLQDDFRIEGMQSNNGILVRDTTPFLKKIPQRIKIILYYWRCLFLYWGKKFGQKN